MLMCSQDLDCHSCVFGIHKSVARCYLDLASVRLKAACVCAALAVLVRMCMCNRELDSLVNIGQLPHVIGSHPHIH